MGQLDPRKQTFVIAIDESLSSGIDLNYNHLCGLSIPAMGGTIIGIQLYTCATETGTYKVLKERDGTIYNIVVDPLVASHALLEPGLLGALRWVKLLAVDDEPVAEAVIAAKVITPAIRQYS